MTYEPLWLFLVVLGPAVGSFLAVIADRLPWGEDVVIAGSACRACGTALTWHDKIPLLSFVALRGACRHCGVPIPGMLWHAEVMGLALPVLAGQVATDPGHLMQGTGFLWCLLGLALCDITALRLPDSLTGTLAALGLGLAWQDPGRGLSDAVLAAGAGMTAFWLLRLGYRTLRGREGLGLGDVKLMAGIGAGLGLTALPVVTLVAALAALAVGLVRALTGRAGLHRDQPIAFGAYLAGAAGLVWLILQ